MGDSAAPGTNESTAAVLQAYSQYLPELLRVTSSNILPMEQAKLQASRATSPGYAQVQSDIYRRFGPQNAHTASEVDRINRLGAANADLAVLSGPGRAVISQADQLARMIDPEFYATRAAASGQLQNLLGSYDLSGLSGGESAAAERATNLYNEGSGLTNPSATRTISNAMQFGDAFERKRQSLAQAIGAATSFLPSSRSGFDPVQTALGRPSQNNGSNFVTPAREAGQNTYDFSSGFMNNIFGLRQREMDINANRRDALDRFNQTWSSVVGSLPSMGV